MSAGELTISDIAATGLGQSSPDDEVHKTSPYVLFESGSEEHKTKKETTAVDEVSWDGETLTIKPRAGESLAVRSWLTVHTPPGFTVLFTGFLQRC